MTQLLNCLSHQYGIEAIALHPLPFGADIHAVVYRAETKNGKSYFVKLKKEEVHSEISTTLLTALHAAGIQQIIPPLKTIQGRSTCSIDHSILTVYPFIEGKNGFNQSLTEEQWFKLGKTLRQIHEFTLPPSLQNQIRRETYSSKWQQIVQSLLTSIEDTSTGDKITLKLIGLLKAHKTLLLRLVDRADYYIEKARHQPHDFVLCHSDLHGGNVLIDPNGEIYIIDWDEPILAPKERDLMFIGGGIANTWNQSHETESFYKGYGSVTINQTLLAYYRYVRIVEDIAIYGQELLSPANSEQDKLEMYQQLIDQFEPGGVIDIALQTDRMNDKA